MTQIIMLLLLMTGSVFACAFLEKRFEEMLPVTCSSIVLLLFVAGIINALKAGTYIVLLLCVVIWIISLFWIFRRNKWRGFLKQFLTPGCCIFVLLYFLLSVLTRDMMASEWDEFSHWADIVKVMVNLEDFGTNPDSGSLFASYPPGMALFQYFFQKVYLLVKPGAVFSEWRMFFAYQVFFLSFMVPFLKNLSFKEPLKVLLMGISIWIGPMLIFTNIYSSIYIDSILGFVAGAGIATIFLQREKEWIYDVYIYLSVAMLVLMKDAGTLFAVFLLILYVTDIVCKRNYKVGKFMLEKIDALKVILGIAALIIPKLLWSLDIKINEATVSFGNKVDIIELVRVILGLEPENYRSVVVKLFSLAILSHKVEIGDTAIELPYIALLIVFAGVTYWLYQKHKNDETKNVRIRKIVVYTLVLQSVVFVIGMCVSYMYKFSESEALELAGFSRYMKIILHLWWIFILLIAVHFAIKGEGKKARIEIFVFCIIMAVVPWSKVSLNITRQTVENSVAARAPYQVLVEQIEEVTQNDRQPSYITVICQETQGYEQLLFRYALRPHHVDWNYSIGKPFYEGDSYTETITAEDWQARLKSKCDYVALYKINDYFVTEFFTVFENPNDIHENGVYRVNKETGLLMLCNVQD